MRCLMTNDQHRHSEHSFVCTGFAAEVGSTSSFAGFEGYQCGWGPPALVPTPRTNDTWGMGWQNLYDVELMEMKAADLTQARPCIPSDACRAAMCRLQYAPAHSWRCVRKMMRTLLHITITDVTESSLPHINPPAVAEVLSHLQQWKGVLMLQGYDVLLYGDSITENWRGTSAGELWKWSNGTLDSRFVGWNMKAAFLTAFQKYRTGVMAIAGAFLHIVSVSTSKQTARRYCLL